MRSTASHKKILKNYGNLFSWLFKTKEMMRSNSRLQQLFPSKNHRNLGEVRVVSAAMWKTAMYASKSEASA